MLVSLSCRREGMLCGEGQSRGGEEGGAHAPRQNIRVVEVKGRAKFGVRVPEDLSVVSFHDVPVAKYLDPPAGRDAQAPVAVRTDLAEWQSCAPCVS